MVPLPDYVKTILLGNKQCIYLYAKMIVLEAEQDTLTEDRKRNNIMCICGR